MTRTTYPPETKAAVMAALLTGQSVSAVAKAYDLPKGTVGRWKDKALGLVQDAGTPEQRVEIGDLLVDYLRTMLASLTVQARHFGDTAWLANQDASQLAVLHGVAVDKAIRLLEAMAAAGQGE